MSFQTSKLPKRKLTEEEFLAKARDIPAAPSSAGPARPRRTKSINLRLTEQELADLQQRAAAEDRSIQQFIRAALREAA